MSSFFHHACRRIGSESGFAALTLIILIFILSVFTVTMLVLSSLSDERVSRDTLQSLRSFAASESGIEDLTLRIVTGKQYPASGTLALNSGSATVESGGMGNERFVTSTALVSSRLRRLITRLSRNTNDVEFHYGAQVGEGGLTMANNARVVGNVYSNGSITGSPNVRISGETWVAGGILPFLNAFWTVQNGDAAFGLATGSVVTVVDGAGNVGLYTSLALGADGFARISYYDDGNDDLKFARCTDADCASAVLTTVDGAGNINHNTSLALGADGFARISYYDDGNDDLKFARCTNADCTTRNITTVDSSGDVGQFSSLALGADGFARISYYDDGNDDLKFARCTDADCATQSIAALDTAGDVGRYSWLQLGSDGFGRMSYYDASNGSVKFVRCTNAPCTARTTEVPDSAGNVGLYTSLALGADGFARISYRDDDAEDLKFIRCANAPCAPSQNQLDLAQSFQTSTTAPIQKVSLFLKKVGSPPNLTIRITRDRSGDPGRSGDVLASGTLPAQQVGASYSWVDVMLTSNPPLTASTTYWILVDTGRDDANYWLWGYDNANAYPYGQGKWSPDWSAGSPFWNAIGGDLDFRVWLGGVVTQIDRVIVGGNAHAHRIANSTVTSNAFSVIFTNSQASGNVATDILQNCSGPIGGDASYNVIGGCVVQGSQTTPTVPPSDPPPQPMPISAAQIAQWQQDAAAGGTISGNFQPSSSTSIGPKVITGNMTVGNGVTLTITGTVFVQGNIQFSNNVLVRLNPAYGPLSGVLLSDGWIRVSNNVQFQGSGTPGSYLMILSNSACLGVATPSCPTSPYAAIDLGNNTSGVIFYAARGLISVSNNVIVNELTGYKIQLANNATIVYEQGLANARFTSGPGASWRVRTWQEVE